MNFTNSGYSSKQIYCGGYSKMVITMIPLNISDWSRNYSITFSLTDLSWQAPPPLYHGGISEYNFSGIQNITVEVSPTFPQRPPWQYWETNPTLIDVKAPYCIPYWSSASSPQAPANWWVTFDVYAYLRNE
jgi:hypothetical protein